MRTGYVPASGRTPCQHFPWHRRRQRRKEKEKKKSKKGKKEKKERKAKKEKKRKREKAPVERSIITGKRIQRKEGSVADQAGEAPLVVATISTHGARVARAVSLGRGGGRGVRVGALRV